MIDEKLVEELSMTIRFAGTITDSNLASVISNITLFREGRVELYDLPWVYHVDVNNIGSDVESFIP